MIASPMTRSVSGSRRAGREQAGTRRGCPCQPVRVALAGQGRCARPAARLRMPAPGALFGDRHGQVARARQGSGSSGVACRGGSHVRPGRRAHPDSQADRSRPGGCVLGASCLGGGVRRRRAGLALLGRRTDGGRALSSPRPKSRRRKKRNWTTGPGAKSTPRIPAILARISQVNFGVGPFER